MAAVDAGEGPMTSFDLVVLAILGPLGRPGFLKIRGVVVVLWW